MDAMVAAEVGDLSLGVPVGFGARARVDRYPLFASDPFDRAVRGRAARDHGPARQLSRAVVAHGARGPRGAGGGVGTIDAVAGGGAAHVVVAGGAGAGVRRRRARARLSRGAA